MEDNDLGMKKWLLVAMITVVWACEPKPDNGKLLDQFIVLTNYDTSANFGSYATYAIPQDTIGFYSNASSDTIITESNSDFPRLVIDQIRSNMNARGYIQVARKDSPDLGINVSVINDFNVFQQVVYGGGYGYGYGYGYYYPDYYGYGGYYYPYVNTYASNTGVLLIEMVDLKNRTANNKVKGIWTANMGDVYKTINLEKQTTDGIDQAFKQSPYLTK